MMYRFLQEGVEIQEMDEESVREVVATAFCEDGKPAFMIDDDGLHGLVRGQFVLIAVPIKACCSDCGAEIIGAHGHCQIPTGDESADS